MRVNLLPALLVVGSVAAWVTAPLTGLPAPSWAPTPDCRRSRGRWACSASGDGGGKAKLNPLETLVKVYAQNSGQRDTRPDRQFLFLTGLPLKPYFDRETIRYEAVPGKIWMFEQAQGFFNVSVNIRMTAVRLEGGGLWVHAPVAPTEECVRLVKELGEEVRYIVLPTTAVEHKVYVKPFSDRFPAAKIYVCPGQWSWPLNLPPPFRADGTLCSGSPPPWGDEIQARFFSPPVEGIGPSNEVLFLHRPTKTLLATDSVIWIPREPPEVVPRADLLEAAREEDEDPGSVEETPENLRWGWANMALQVQFLGPATPTTFDLLAGRLIVSPVLRELVLGRVTPYVRAFVESLCSEWDFARVIGCHYAAPVPAGPAEFRRAFSFAFLEEEDGGGPGGGDSEAAAQAAAGRRPWAAAGGLLAAVTQGLGGGKSAGPQGGCKGLVDDLAAVPAGDLATIEYLKGFLADYGLAQAKPEQP